MSKHSSSYIPLFFQTNSIFIEPWTDCFKKHTMYTWLNSNFWVASYLLKTFSSAQKKPHHQTSLFTYNKQEKKLDV